MWKQASLHLAISSLLLSHLLAASEVKRPVSRSPIVPKIKWTILSDSQDVRDELLDINVWRVAVQLNKSVKKVDLLLCKTDLDRDQVLAELKNIPVSQFPLGTPILLTAGLYPVGGSRFEAAKMKFVLQIDGFKTGKGNRVAPQRAVATQSNPMQGREEFYIGDSPRFPSLGESEDTDSLKKIPLAGTVKFWLDEFDTPGVLILGEHGKIILIVKAH
jgi:hypothetical protein